MRIGLGGQASRTSLRTRILAIALIPSLSLMLVGLGAAVASGYQGYQATTESGQYAALSGIGRDAGGHAATRKLLQALRDERRLTGEVLGDPAASTATLRAQWATSDAAAAAVAQPSARAIVSAARFATLMAARPSVESRSVALVDALDGYSAAIVEIDGQSSSALSRAVADPRVVREDEISMQLRDLTEAVEVSDALSFSAFTGTGMSGDAFRALARGTGDSQALLSRLQPSLPADEAADLNRLTTGADGEIVAVVQRSILHGSVLRRAATETAGAGGQPAAAPERTAVAAGIRIEDVRVVASLPAPRADWRAAAAHLAAGLVALQDRHLAYSAGIARDVGRQKVTMALMGSLALLLFAIAVLAVSLAASGRLSGRLLKLRQDTIRLSHERLPDIVQRLREGQDVDVDAEVPALDYGSDEIGQVAEAFRTAQRTAVTAAAHEADLRAGLRTVFLDIARRSQSIVHRQLRLLDRAERSQEDPDHLALLFELDHLSTRARRNAENLIILAGGQVGRQWRDPVSLRDVVRSAVSEAKDYARVTVAGLPKVTVRVAVVADLIHLLAEIVDNATTFSPPQARVEVWGNVVGRGLVIEIEDQGLGIEADQLGQFNQLLHDPPDFQVMALAVEPRLGLFVVGQLAARHGIRVTLTPSSAYGGTKAVVLVPATLLLDERGQPEPRALATKTHQAGDRG